MSKHNENRRKLHAAMLVKRMNKKGEQQNQDSTEDSALVQQYRVIRDDLMKLRDDLTRGYDMAKDAVEKRTILNELMKIRESL